MPIEMSVSENLFSAALPAPSADEDGSKPGVYALTLTLKERRPLLGTLIVPQAGDVPDPEQAYVEKSGLGAEVEWTIRALPELCPEAEVLLAAVMPDHVHLLLRLHEHPRVSLPVLVLALKNVTEESAQQPLWNEGCTSCFLAEKEQVVRASENIFRNPYRLAMRQLGREYLIIRRARETAGRTVDCIGNQALLERPIRPVRIGRRLTPEEKRNCKNACILDARQGAVLAGAFISPDEKAVLQQALKEKLPVVMLQAECIPTGYVPAGNLREACLEGRLLILNPWPDNDGRKTITREQCLALNRLAEDLADDVL